MTADPRAAAVRAGYASVAAGYRAALADELAQKPLDRAFLDAFAERCAGGQILDVGCGPGQVAAHLAGRGAQVAGVDLSPEMIAEARAAHPALGFAVGDMFALPHAAGSLAGVVGFYAIVHLATAELSGALRELARVLAADGLLALAFHAGDERVHVDELFGAATSLDFVFHDPAAVIAAVTAAGFVLEARLDRAPYPAEHPTQRCYLLARRSAG